MDDVFELKRKAAEQALAYVEDGMTLGLGAGSTTMIFIDLLGERVQAGDFPNLRGVPTSEGTAARARGLGIPLEKLADVGSLDLAVDGADEVDPDLNLIKGLGRALLREKIIEIHTKRLLIIVDDRKIVPRLGTTVPLPVEVLPFEADVSVRWLNTLGCEAALWYEDDGELIVTDNGNYLARCWFSEGIADPHILADLLAHRPGIVEHGLFLDMADLVLVADAEGTRTLTRKR